MTSKPAAPPAPPAASPDEAPEAQENEVLRETRRLRDLAAAAEAKLKAAKDGAGWKTAAGIGIGSAALLAAVLYANRQKD